MNSKNIIKPLIQGRDIKKWAYTDSGKYLIFTKQGVEIDQYAGIEEYLKQFKTSLLPGVGRKYGKYKWYEIQDNTAYYPEFDKKKIIWGLTANKWAFAYDEQKHFLPSNGYILTSRFVPIKYLLGVLNSKLQKFYFNFIGIMTAGGAFTLKHETISELPVIINDNESISNIIKVVEKIIYLTESKNYFDNPGKQQEVTKYEGQIDELVYRLYNLTPEEVKIVEESTK